MSDSERSPLLSGNQDQRDTAAAETTPLISGNDTRYDGSETRENGDGASVHSLRSTTSSTKSNTKSRRRWPSIIAIILLAVVSITVIVGVFFVPTAVEQYAKEAAVIEPTNLSLNSITKDGIRARIQANFRLDGSKVKNDHVRRIGKAATWVVRAIGTEETTVNVYLPEYEQILLGSAIVPPMSIRLVNGETTPIDLVVGLVPGEADGIRQIANEWLQGRLSELRVQGVANVALKSGIFPLGKHTVSEYLTFEAGNIPEKPKYNITKLNFQDHGDHAMEAVVSLEAFNEYPIEFDIPGLGFEVLVPNCGLYDPYILVATATTKPIHLKPKSLVAAQVQGVIGELPDSLTRHCPQTDSSPLDSFLKSYLDGKEATVFVRGSRQPHLDTPEWLNALLVSVTVPIPFPGRSFDNLIRKFSLTDVHFSLPSPMADPDDDEASPRVSGTIQVIAGLPSEMNFDINVTNVRATADVFYHKNKLGELDLHRWQDANSTKIDSATTNTTELMIQSQIKDVPLNVTDADVLSDVIEKLLFGNKKVLLDIKALVDVKVVTVLGELVIRDVPAEGQIPVKPIPTGGQGTVPQLAPKISDLEVLVTSPDSLSLRTIANMTNPTPYSGHIPFINVHILCNGTVIGEATAENLDIVPGHNSDLIINAIYKPSNGGPEGVSKGRNLLSQYISGFNTSVTVKAHKDSIPGQPLISDALSRFNISVAAPHLDIPNDSDDGDEDDDGDDSSKKKTRFIKDATFHLVSSSATFTLLSPLRHNTVYLERINATAFYNHTEPVGQILYDYPFKATPGASQTPRLPVTWSLDSVGYEKVRKALGGELKLDAEATVDIRIGNWRQQVWYTGQGIGARVRI